MSLNFLKLVNSPQFLLEVAKGNVDGFSSVHVFAENPSIDIAAQEDIWEYGGTYTYLSSASTLYLSSSDDADTQDIEITGLDTNYVLQTVTQTLNGQTKTEIGSGITWVRIHKVKNVGSTDLSGSLYVYEDDTTDVGVPNTASKVKAYIYDGNNQTLMSHFCVPANTYALPISLNLDLTSKAASKITVTLRVRPFGQVFENRGIYGINEYHGHELVFDLPTLIQPKSDIKLIATASSDDSAVAAEYFLLLIDSDYLEM